MRSAARVRTFGIGTPRVTAAIAVALGLVLELTACTTTPPNPHRHDQRDGDIQRDPRARPARRGRPPAVSRVWPDFDGDGAADLAVGVCRDN